MRGESRGERLCEARWWRRVVVGGAVGGVSFPTPLLALQLHNDPEGLYVHQLAHLFFALSMVILIYRFRKMGLLREPGWRRIAWAAAFFTIWNLDAYVGHWIESREDCEILQEGSQWGGTVVLRCASPVMNLLYYVVKLDHLWCVPAALFLYFGLASILAEHHHVRDES